ncbi:MAG: hydrolase [Saccharospirillum sp.]|nr:hydrolase [Saccharospirillum sp.]
MTRHPFIADAQRSLLLLVDFQAGMSKIISQWPDLMDRTGLLIEAAQRLQVPIVATEQYPEGLGPTEDTLLSAIGLDNVLTKTHFSACLEPDFVERLRLSGKDTIVLAGVESHVCVLQTGLDLLAQGYRVHLVADAVSSRRESDKAIAVEQFRSAGAVIGSAETVVFEWLKQAKTDDFRALLPRIK